MLLLMITIRHRALGLTLAAVAIAAGRTTFAEARPNPYTPIVERNAFGLKPPPPPVVETNQPAPAPPVKVILTGITSMFGPGSERVFLEITEGEPGKQAGTPKRPMLGPGDREGGVEVVSIDIERNIVKIRNGFVESELTFEAPKPAAGGGAPAPTGRPAVNTAAAPSNQPTIISESESRGGITMLGGGGGFAGNTAGVTSYGANSPTSTGGSGGISSYGGVQPMGAPGFAGPSGGLAAIPSRTLRTPQPTQQQAIDPHVQEILIEANKIANQTPKPSPKPGGAPIIYPPLPPTRIGAEMNGPPGPPGFPQF